MIVAVGSTNRAKIDGVIEAYKLFNIDIEIVPVKVPSGISHQPKSLEETVKGAVNRALNALKVVENADEAVGIESGLIMMPIINRFIDITIAVIIDRRGRLSAGLSPGFEIPSNFIREIFTNNKELEELAVKVSGIENIGEHGGFISYLTYSKISRKELTKLAVIMALTPRISPIRGMYMRE